MSETEQLVVWRDIMHVARIEVSTSFVMDFEVLEMYGFEGDLNGPVIYVQKGAKSSADTTSDPSDAQVLVSGMIKFDGCSEWSFSKEHALHLCGRRNFKEFAYAQRRLFDEASKRLENWCGDDEFTLTFEASSPESTESAAENER